MKSKDLDIQVRRLESYFAVLSESYSIINRICWQGGLPPCLMRMSHRLSYKTLAYAQKRSDDHRIVFNASFFRHRNDTEFLLTMAHEMIHIWQYECGGRGGHGRDFKDEQNRLFGISVPVRRPPGIAIPRDSPMGYVFFMHEIKNLHPIEAARKIASCRDHRKCEISFFYSIFKQTK